MSSNCGPNIPVRAVGDPGHIADHNKLHCLYDTAIFFEDDGSNYKAISPVNNRGIEIANLGSSSSIIVGSSISGGVISTTGSVTMDSPGGSIIINGHDFLGLVASEASGTLTLAANNTDGSININATGTNGLIASTSEVLSFETTNGNISLTSSDRLVVNTGDRILINTADRVTITTGNSSTFTVNSGYFDINTVHDLTFDANLVNLNAVGPMSISSSDMTIVGNGGQIAVLVPGERIIISGDEFNCSTTNVGFYGATPVPQQTGVAVSAAAIHAALVALGLITA